MAIGLDISKAVGQRCILANSESLDYPEFLLGNNRNPHQSLDSGKSGSSAKMLLWERGISTQQIKDYTEETLDTFDQWEPEEDIHMRSLSKPMSLQNKLMGQED